MIEIFCETCSRRFLVYPYRAKTAKFCSPSCARKAQVGNKIGNWKGGRTINAAGYVLVRMKNRYVYEHRLVMEKLLGRKLKRFEHVHHLNGNKADNGKENLELIDGHSHNRIDTKNRWRKNPDSFISAKRRCLKPRTGYHHRGELCQRYYPCFFHSD